MSCNCCPPEFPQGTCETLINQTYNCSTNDDWAVTIDNSFISGTYIPTIINFDGSKTGTLLTQNLIDILGTTVTFQCGAIPASPPCFMPHTPSLIGLLSGGEGRIGCRQNTIGCYVLNGHAIGPMSCGPDDLAIAGSLDITFYCGGTFAAEACGPGCSNIGVRFTLRASAHLGLGIGQQTSVETLCDYNGPTITLLNTGRMTLYRTIVPHFQQLQQIYTGQPFRPGMIQNVYDAFLDWPETIEVEKL